jgi:hypothetical protein
VERIVFRDNRGSALLSPRVDPCLYSGVLSVRNHKHLRVVLPLVVLQESFCGLPCVKLRSPVKGHAFRLVSRCYWDILEFRNVMPKRSSGEPAAVSRVRGISIGDRSPACLNVREAGA